MRTTAPGRRAIRLLSLLVLVLVLLVSGRYFFRADLTAGRRFSVSEHSRAFLRELREPVRITYYVSPELLRLYPQTRNIGDFLMAYASESGFVSVVTADPAEEGLEASLAAQGILGRQVQSASGNRTEYATVYSAVLIEYLDMTSAVPFILSDESLEYELTSRLMRLVDERTRPVLVMCGNGLSVRDDYSYVLPWLETAGFACSEIAARDFSAMMARLERDGPGTVPLVVLGTSALSPEQSEEIRAFAESGGNAVVFSSTITADIYGGWEAVPSGGDAFSRVLDGWGLPLGGGILGDISCFRMTLYSDDDVPQYETLNYPMWISPLARYCSDNPIAAQVAGAHFFWANPVLAADGDAEILVRTSPAAWCVEPDTGRSPAFVTNPFMVPRTASEAGLVPGQYTLAAQKQLPDGGGRVVLVPDHYFLSTMLLDYSGSSANLDFLVNALLSLSKEDALLGIRNRAKVSTSLDKADYAALAAARPYVLAATCVVFPLLPGLAAAAVWCVRRLRGKGRGGRACRNGGGG